MPRWFNINKIDGELCRERMKFIIYQYKSSKANPSIRLLFGHHPCPCLFSPSPFPDLFLLLFLAPSPCLSEQLPACQTWARMSQEPASPQGALVSTAQGPSQLAPCSLPPHLQPECWCTGCAGQDGRLQRVGTRVSKRRRSLGCAARGTLQQVN